MPEKKHSTRDPEYLFEFSGPKGRFMAGAKTKNPLTLYKALAKAYSAEKLPSWAIPKLQEMAEARIAMRHAQDALDTAIYGDPARKNILQEIRHWQSVYDNCEKVVRAALTGPKMRPTMQEVREGIAQDAIESTEFGKKLQRAQGKES